MNNFLHNIREKIQHSFGSIKKSMNGINKKFFEKMLKL
jgi:hypothetical protein